MLTDLCQELKNWFDRDMPKLYGTFTIHNNDIFIIENGVEVSISSKGLADGQYFSIIKSVFNDGVHQYPASDLNDEQFDGAVWFMAIPHSVILLDIKITEWQEKYAEVASSPYVSESFGGYSRTLKTSSSDGSNPTTWQGVFRSELNKWRKI